MGWKKGNPKSKTIASIRKKAWKEFSIFIRRREADFYGITECITCGFKAHWKEMNAGHYHHNKLDYDEMNVNAQCPRCNKWLSGNLGNYAMYLIDKYGLEKKKELDERAAITTLEKLYYGDYEQIYLKYKALNSAKEI